MTNVEHPRITREKKTIKTMVSIYCKAKHKTKNELCPECNQFFEYAKIRLDNCPFQENKTTCGKCRIHCYKPDMRDKVKAIMRYSGPRMLLHHPGLAMHHAIDGFKKPEDTKVKPRLISNN
jgi:predicted amidophosphoribosyltransferase